MTRRALDGVPVTAEEYGFILRGRIRALEVAIAHLIQANALRVNREGELSTTGAPIQASQLQVEVLTTIWDATTPMVAVVDAVALGASMNELQDRLRSRDLLPKRQVLPLRRSTRVARANDRLTYARMLPAAMLTTAGGLVAVGGYAAYPDPEIAAALEMGRAGYSDRGHGCSSGAGCGGGCGGGGCGGGGS